MSPLSTWKAAVSNPHPPLTVRSLKKWITENNIPDTAVLTDENGIALRQAATGRWWSGAAGKMQAAVALSRWTR